jgi:hypothetical protein
MIPVDQTAFRRGPARNEVFIRMVYTELLRFQSRREARFELRRVFSDDSGMDTPLRASRPALIQCWQMGRR